MTGAQTIEEFVERITTQAKRLPKEQAHAVASCLEYALRGSQDDRLYAMLDNLYDHINQPQNPLLHIDTMHGNINALDPHNDDNPNQQSQRECKHLQQ